MISLLQLRLKEHLSAALAWIKLYGQSDRGDVTTSPQVFIGDIPPKRKNTPDRTVREVPCVVIVPLSGHIEVEDGAATSVALIALSCCVYNPDREENGDVTGVESDLANLVSAVCAALLPCAEGEPLARRFVLVPDEKGKTLAWVRPEEQPGPFASATITSRWHFKGWE
ncbi:MAG: hypothetical protein LBC94_02795 [Desulfovibrio sp.]|jgi:hypothetical protein|nr:hypothetical protein [Desulfovibrio sp.]